MSDMDNQIEQERLHLKKCDYNLGYCADNDPQCECEAVTPIEQERVEAIVRRIMQIDAFADTEECTFPPFECNEEQQDALDKWFDSFVKAMEEHVRGAIEELLLIIPPSAEWTKERKEIEEALGYALNSETFSAWGHDKIRKNAATWLRNSLDREEQLIAEIEKARSLRDFAVKKSNELIAENERLQKHKDDGWKEAREAIEQSNKSADTQNKMIVSIRDENERLKEENISLLASGVIDANDNVKLRSKVAEQDKEIQHWKDRADRAETLLEDIMHGN